MFLYLLYCSWFAALASASLVPPFAPEHAEFHFERFIKQHNKTYDPIERAMRFKIFQDNMKGALRMHTQFNINIFGYVQFLDLTQAEFINSYTGLIIPENPENVCNVFFEEDIPNVNVPESWDWRDLNYVSPVQNQKACKSCYAFSAIGNIEGQYAKKYKQLLKLSEQQIVDCDRRNGGCRNGGHMTYAFRTLIERGGPVEAASYPYVEVEQYCRLDKPWSKVRLVDCNYYQLRSQEKLKQLLYMVGPLSVGVRGTGLQNYLWSDILPESYCIENVNHAVLLVGYGSENGIPYWIVKNSWGPHWGDHGYVKIRRGEDTDSCGIMNSLISTAVVA